MPTNPTQPPSAFGLARGSEWRKWDLHVHSPASGLNNQFPKLPGGEPDWESYVQELEGLTDVAVLGITDYFSIEGYRKVQEFRGSGRLKNIALLLPNIELRLNTFTLGSGGARRINYHVVFSDELAVEEIENHFLSQLTFTYESAPDDGSSSWPLNRVNLGFLGARLKREHPTFQGLDYEIGCMNATIDAESIKNLLKSKATIFKGKFLIVVENTSALDWHSQAHHTRKTLLQGAHAMFSGNPRTIRWARGEDDLSAEAFVAEFKSLKPCLHGSDAHKLDDICNPAEGRLCWIKADTTFEGLKQVLYEPRDRIYIGETPAGVKNDDQVIEAVEVDSPAWFLSSRIPLNKDLVAIIGGRGSGKSALAEAIAFSGGSKFFTSGEDITDSFLFKASKRSSTNPSPIMGAKIILRWQDGTTSPASIGATLQHGLRDEKVKYLPQKFVERLCDPENNQQLEEEIERVIFQRIDKTDRLDASDFRELRDTATKGINLKKSQIRKEVRSLNQSIFELSVRIELRPAKVTELNSRKAELDTLKKQAPQVPLADEQEVKRREDLSKVKQDLENRIVKLGEQLATLGTIETKLEIIRGEIATFNSEITELIESVALSDEKASFTITMPTGATAILARNQREINDAVKALKEGSAKQPSVESLKSIDAQIKDLDQKSQLTETKRKQHEKFQKDRQQLEDTIASLEREIKEIEEVVIPRLQKEMQNRLTKYCEFFDLLKEEKSLLERLYEPLERALLNSNETARKLAFISRVTLDIAGQASSGYDLLDRRKVFREDDSLEAAFRSFFSSIEEADYSRSSIETGLRNLRAFAATEGTVMDVADSLRKDKTLKNFDDWFYGTEGFEVSYSIKYDGKDLQFLSPGEKGIVLLLLYLEAEQEDNRPLVIDQPDDNLDNLSVYPSLVEYFRNRKKTRQIVIITHNPNLVVNTDAEQIIVANFDGSRTPRISYTSGALENTDATGPSQGIRENVCKILEGGTEAFQKRERKYALPEG